MLSTSKNVIFPGHNHHAGAQAIFKVSGHQHWRLAGGYDPFYFIWAYLGSPKLTREKK